VCAQGNKIRNDGIEAIAKGLATNHSLVELVLFKVLSLSLSLSLSLNTRQIRIKHASNTHQHASTRIKHASTRINTHQHASNTHQTRINTHQHTSTRINTHQHASTRINTLKNTEPGTSACHALIASFDTNMYLRKINW